MAGDWIKMREALFEDPAVLAMANALETRPEHVVGYCHRFWSWVSRNCHAGSVTGVTLDALESVLNLPGFLRIMCAVGWLVYDDTPGNEVLRIPNFNRHLSQGAKSRALNAERQKTRRHADVTEMSRAQRDKIDTREEKRREENNTPPISPPDECACASGAHVHTRGECASDAQIPGGRKAEKPDRFEAWWLIVHHRTGKDRARTAYRNAVKRLAVGRDAPDDPHAFLIERMTAFAASPNAKPPDRTPIHPATWLNQGRYLDDPATWQFVPRTKHSEAIPI